MSALLPPMISATLAPAADDAASPGFEGVEKVMEIDFAPGFGAAAGLRAIARADWDAVCAAAKCTILSALSNDRCDSYVLSESSLFVYPLKLVLKTCGTTTLLMALPKLLEITQVRGRRGGGGAGHIAGGWRAAAGAERGCGGGRARARLQAALAAHAPSHAAALLWRHTRLTRRHTRLIPPHIHSCCR